MLKRHGRLAALLMFLVSIFAGVGLLVAQVNGPAESGDDGAFLKNAALGSAWRVDLGNIAAKQTATKEVRDFAAHTVNRYSLLGRQLDELAGKKGITLPRRLDEVRQNTTAYMAGRKGAALDREYVSAVADDLAGDLKSFRREARSGKDPDVRAFASATMKMLEEDLNRAERLLKELPQPILK